MSSLTKSQFADKRHDLDIRTVIVYDPKAQAGIDFLQWQAGHEALRRINPKLEYCVSDALYEKVKRSEVTQGVTLQDYLYNYEGGFFASQPCTAVVFIDGKFEGQYIDESKIDRVALAQRTNSIPFIFGRPVELDSE